MPEKNRPMSKRHTFILQILIGTSVFFLSTQLIVWRSFNPFQSGAEELDADQKMNMLLQETEERQVQPSSLHVVHHSNMHHGNKSFCLGWTTQDAFNRSLQPFDYWWVHHPTWVISNETEDMFCVEPGKDAALMQTFLKYYKVQFQSGCKEIQWRHMWSSGWGADMMNVQSGLAVSLNLSIPLVVGLSDPWNEASKNDREPWHYAANKDDGSNKTCPQADLTCYFLPYHNCGSLDEIDRNAKNIKFIPNEEVPEEGEIYTKEGRMANAFLTRKQLWLRRAVFDFKHKFKSQYPPESDCSVIHVRRSDVVLHDQWSRKYYPVTDYVQLIPSRKRRDPHHTVFLLTDDANAIAEAHEFHPEIRWKYINRTRYKGTSGGWEHQTPSNNPASEVITLLATFDLVQECSLLVHGSSKFSEMLWFMMLEGNENATQRRVDKNEKVYSPDHASSELELMQRLNAMRQGPNNSSSVKVSHMTRPSHNETHPTGLIIVNILGLLANDLFEAAFAARMAEQLGWRVVYRTMWNPAFPTEKTDMCFPNVRRKIIEAEDMHSEDDPIWVFLKEHVGNHSSSLQQLYDAVTYVDMEDNGDNLVNNQDDANKLVLDWIRGLGPKAKSIQHMEYPLQEFHVDTLVEELRNPNSPVKVLQLEAFFIHFDWMKEWMGPNHIPHWLKINQDPECCPTPAPKLNTIVIHIRDFNPEDDDKNKNLQVGVFRDIINKYYGNEQKEVWVVCQPKSVKSEVVQGLVKELNAQVHTGDDNIDAFCILARARIHIPTTSSSFSQMAALLAESHIKGTYGTEHDVEVHYPTHTLDHPMVTLKVPGWKYHLTNEECNAINEFNVNHKRLSVTQA